MSDVRRILEKKEDKSIATVGCETSVLDAANMMNERKIGSVVVVEGGRVVGILTERDLLTRIIAQNRRPDQTAVREVMTTPVAVAGFSTSAEELRAVMRERRIRHVPIVEDGKLEGIISIGDLNWAKHLEQEETIRYLEQYIYKP